MSWLLAAPWAAAFRCATATRTGGGAAAHRGEARGRIVFGRRSLTAADHAAEGQRRRSAPAGSGSAAQGRRRETGALGDVRLGSALAMYKGTKARRRPGTHA
jgi:hypothetical protein